MPKSILVVAAHSDDETIGCGGTISRHVSEGNEVHLLFMTDGVGSRNGENCDVNERLVSAKKATKILGVNSMQNLSFPDNKMDSVPLLDVTQAIEKKVVEIQPDIIYTHHIGDLNIDHQVTHKAVITACRPQPNFCVKEIYAFEVLSSTEWHTQISEYFVPNVFVDITDFLSIKMQAFKSYQSEIREVPHSRSEEHLELLAKHRGYCVGVKAAEAFMLVRSII
jgi:LmbE family N-acetylglucosaminyl deacetylase